MNFGDDLLARALDAAPMLILNRILAEFEPTITHLTIRHAAVDDAIRVIRSTPHDGFGRFSKNIGRHNFLYAAHQHLHRINDHEEILVALGRTSGPAGRQRSHIQGVWRGVGGRSAASFTPNVWHAMKQQAHVVDKGEVIIVHNHPSHDLKTFIAGLFGWKPLPSSTDRDTALAHNTDSLLQWLTRGQLGGFRWYLIDEGSLAEFYLPSIEWFQDIFAHMSRMQSAP